MLYWGINRPRFIITDVIPLFYCSLFIEALLCAAWGKGFIRKLGESFVMIGVVGGWLGLFASEIFNARFPLFNYYALLTLCYHSAMIYFGYAIYIGKVYKLDRYTFLNYAAFLTPFFILAAVLNASLDVNFMMIRPTSAVYPALLDLGCIFGEKFYTPMVIFYYYVGIFLISATPMTVANIISARVRAKKTEKIQPCKKSYGNTVNK